MADLENGPHPDDVEPSLYGHGYPILDKLADWVTACDPYTIPEPSAENPLALVEAGRALNSAIIDLVPYSSEDEIRSKAYYVRAHIRDLTAQFIFHEYTDSNTDEPCDAEWNVTGLLMLVHPEYQRPDDIRPAYVGYLIDKGRDEDREVS
jgi:hypothetical protein